jgi:predicted ABC-type ATPase
VSAPRVAIVAGPNGSGKTTFYEARLRAQFPVFVNADEIAKSLESVPHELRNKKAADQAEQQRLEFLEAHLDFALETVFSRSPYWIEFIRRLKQADFEVSVHFICTESPLLNVARIEAREQLGGHGVPASKVVSRFQGSIRTALMAKDLVDELWLWDNSSPESEHRLVGRFVRGEVDFLADSLPHWAEPLFLL